MHRFERRFTCVATLPVHERTRSTPFPTPTVQTTGIPRAEVVAKPLFTKTVVEPAETPIRHIDRLTVRAILPHKPQV